MVLTRAANISVYMGLAHFRRLVRTIRLHGILPVGTSGNGCVHARPVISYHVPNGDRRETVIDTIKSYRPIHGQRRTVGSKPNAA